MTDTPDLIPLFSADELPRVQAERDELLAALTELDMILDFSADFSPCECFPAIDGLKSAADRARRAIDKAKGRP